MRQQKYAILRSQLEKNGKIISERDTQIAAVALAHQLTVITHNLRAFGPVAGLKVKDWA